MTITTLAQARSKESLIALIMSQTGWSKAKAKQAIRELEENHLLIFPATGGMGLSLSRGVI